MAYEEDEYLKLSGIQHFQFCPRQWALIHIENQWVDNFLTIDGQLIHKRAHNENNVEISDDLIIVRGLRVASRDLGCSGECDVVEFHRVEKGITLPGQAGYWSVFPIEYKRGKGDLNSASMLQLCAEAMCLEEMFKTNIPSGAIYNNAIRRRNVITFSKELKIEVRRVFVKMHEIYLSGTTPKPDLRKGCHSCSFYDSCLPILSHGDVKSYIDSRTGEFE